MWIHRFVLSQTDCVKKKKNGTRADQNTLFIPTMYGTLYRMDIKYANPASLLKPFTNR